MDGARLTHLIVCVLCLLEKYLFFLLVVPSNVINFFSSIGRSNRGLSCSFKDATFFQNKHTHF